MKFVSPGFLILFLLSSCITDPDSLFRPDFGNKSKNRYETPPAEKQHAGKQDITPSVSTSTNTDFSPHNKLSSAKHTRSEKISSELKLRGPEKTPVLVDQYYRQQLNLQKGDTVPGYTPPLPEKKDDSWWYRLFGTSKTLPPSASNSCYEGILTKEGVTCQAMRTVDGRLLTLGGPLRGFGAGDRVCVCGPPSVTSFCQQGTTIYVALIDDSCP